MTEVKEANCELHVGRYCARTISPLQTELFDACLRLRYEYFVRTRGWVIENNATPSGLERDRYDDHAIHLAVYEGAELLVYLRLLPYQLDTGFMLEHEFKNVLGDDVLPWLHNPLDTVVELSRLVCRNDLFSSRNPDRNFHPLELLLKLLYSTSLQNGFSIFYIVVEESWLRPFARRFGLPFRVIGTPFVFADGTRTVAAAATLQELETAMRCHNPIKYDWYCQSDVNDHAAPQ